MGGWGMLLVTALVSVGVETAIRYFEGNPEKTVDDFLAAGRKGALAQVQFEQLARMKDQERAVETFVAPQEDVQRALQLAALEMGPGGAGGDPRLDALIRGAIQQAGVSPEDVDLASDPRQVDPFAGLSSPLSRLALQKAPVAPKKVGVGEVEREGMV